MLVVLASALHSLAAVVWVGGLFFAAVVLRPAAGARRFALWNRALKRFFPWVTTAMVLLPATGYLRMALDPAGLGGIGWHAIAMNLTGWAMIGLQAFVHFGPFRRLQAAAEAETWQVAAKQLDTIRRAILANLALGLVTIAIGASGRFW